MEKEKKEKRKQEEKERGKKESEFVKPYFQKEDYWQNNFIKASDNINVSKKIALRMPHKK